MYVEYFTMYNIQSKVGLCAHFVLKDTGKVEHVYGTRYISVAYIMTYNQVLCWNTL